MNRGEEVEAGPCTSSPITARTLEGDVSLEGSENPGAKRKGPPSALSIPALNGGFSAQLG